MVDGPVVVLAVGAEFSFATSAALVARTVCNCSLKLLLVVVGTGAYQFSGYEGAGRGGRGGGEGRRRGFRTD